MRAITYFRAYVECRDELSEIQSTIPLRVAKYLEAYKQEPPVGKRAVLLAGLATEASYYTQLWDRRDRLMQKLEHKLETLLDEGEET